MSIELLLIILCGLVVLSYFFSIISQHIKIPSVLLLLFAGIGFRLIAEAYQFAIFIPTSIVQGLGVIGLIMIVLEAGLDLKITKDKVSLIRSSFFSALIILVVSTVAITFILRFWLQEDITRCIVYALPLSIMSSSITLPSIHPLTARKKEFLVYEASFSDILGILFFNYFTAREILTARSIGLFGFNIVVSIILSLVISFLLFLILTKTRLNVKFFLVFSLLILIYSGGKILHLPSLLIILVFGIMINNWEQIPLPSLVKRFPQNEVSTLRNFLHSITAESSFLVRTFFFILFGFSIDLDFLYNQEVLVIGSFIVIALFAVRWLYLRYFFHTKVFPEAFFIPRGLVTIVLFYKIPDYLKLTTFNDGILFFIVLCTSIILAIGMMFYKKQNEDVVEEPQFLDKKDLL